MNPVHGEGHGSAHERLSAMTTIGEVLETAMAFEKTAETFYAALARKVPKPMRELVEELATEEAGHYRLFDEVRKRPDTQAHVAEQIATPPSDHKFSNFVQMPQLDDTPDDQAVLQYALAREQAAYEQYDSLAQSAPEGALRNLFRYLADEELRHKGELEKRYYEVVHSGGV